MEPFRPSSLKPHASRLLLAAALFLAPGAALAAQGPAGPPPFALRLEQAASPAPGEEGEVVLVVAAAPGIHLYRDRLRVAAASGSDLELAEALVPEGQPLVDPNGEEFLALSGEFRLRLRLRLPAGFAQARARLALTVTGEGCSDLFCYLPQTVELRSELAVSTAPQASTSPAAPAPTSAQARPPPAASPATPAPTPEAAGWSGRGRLLNLGLAFALGLLIGFSPCVYPLLPVTAAIIAGAGRPGAARGLLRSLAYVLGLALAFGGLGAALGAAGKAGGFALDRPAARLAVAAVFVVFAGSLFDFYSLRLPWRRTAPGGGERGLLGVFLLGALSSVAATPCATAPLAGLLAAAATQGALGGFLLLFCLALGLGTVLALTGVAASLLPRPGAWLESSRLFFGCVMLAGALYFAWPVIGTGWFLLGLAGTLVLAVALTGGYDAPANTPARIFRALGLAATGLALLLAWNGAARLGLVAGAVPGAGAAATEYAAESEAERLLTEPGPPVVLEFSRENCPACRELELTVLSRPEVRQALARRRFLRVNLLYARRLPDRFGILGAPTVVFFGPDGKERTELRVTGVIGKDEFLRRLEELEESQ